MNWKSIIVTALITGLVTVITGTILFWWQDKEPELTYNYIKSIPFEGSGNKVFIQQFEITNSGDETAENISLSITFPESTIDKSNIRIDNAIKHIKKIEDNVITLTIESLNPSEGLSLSVLLQGKTKVLSDPIVSLRAKGVVGEKIGAKKNELSSAIGIALVAAYMGILAFMLRSERFRENFLIIIYRLLRGQGLSTDSQKEVLASLLSMHGFTEKAKEYLNCNSSRRYWVEAGLIAAEAIAENDETKQKMLLVLLRLSELKVLASPSKAIIFYNIARIHKSLSSDEVEVFLEKAKEIDSKEIEERLNRDPIFN